MRRNLKTNYDTSTMFVVESLMQEKTNFQQVKHRAMNQVL